MYPLLAGNCNLIYAIIRKRNVFHHLANLPSDAASIQRALQQKKKKKKQQPPGVSRADSAESVDGSRPAEPGTLKASLEATPGTEPLSVY